MLVKFVFVLITLLGVIVIPYLVGMIPTLSFLSPLPNYLRGLIYLFILVIGIGIYQKYFIHLVDENENRINLK